MDYEKEYKRKALEPIVNYIESVLASYSKEELEARIKDALPEKESEDERVRKHIIKILDNLAPCHWDGNEKAKCIAYLEKQKEQKPAEWSEEDEKYLNLATNIVASDLGEDSPTVSWLKSLRPQPHWKPSEEQMDILDKVYHYLWADRNATADMQDGLGDFIDDLKKLL